METEARYNPGVLKAYEGEGIIVRWEPKFCIHAANCIRHQPGVFDPQARPWVNVTAANADAIAEAIESCPTGALSYERTDGEPGETPESPISVRARRNGPLFLRGDIEIQDAEGGLLRASPRMALCRCGASRNKPFCDNSHRESGFRG